MNAPREDNTWPRSSEGTNEDSLWDKGSGEGSETALAKLKQQENTKSRSKLNADEADEGPSAD